MYILNTEYFLYRPVAKLSNRTFARHGIETYYAKRKIVFFSLYEISKVKHKVL